MREFRRILAAIDGAPITRSIVDVAALLGTAHQASVTLLYIREEQVLTTALAVRAGTLPPEEPTTYGTTILRNADADLRGRGIPTKVEYRTGHAGPEIVQVALRGKYDIIVVGSEGQGVLRRLLRGSVCDYVVNRAPCPVLVVRPDSSREHVPRVGASHGDEEGRPDETDPLPVEPR